MAKKVRQEKDVCHLSGMHAMVYTFLIILGWILLSMFFVGKLGYPEEIYGLVYFGFWFVVTLVMLLLYEYA